ncbi:hypothetical protein ABPG72_016163 [Tetrahymena utriculariae]
MGSSVQNKEGYLRNQATISKIFKKVDFGCILLQSHYTDCQSHLLSAQSKSDSIGDNGSKYLREALLKSINLTYLKQFLKENQIGEDRATYLGEGLSTCINLIALFINIEKSSIDNMDLDIQEIGFQICVNGAIYLGEILSKHVNLTSLVLYLQESTDTKNGTKDSICQFGARYIGEGISKCINLASQVLDLGDNRLYGNGTRYLGEQISKCLNITSLVLDLQRNNVDEVGTLKLCQTYFSNAQSNQLQYGEQLWGYQSKVFRISTIKVDQSHFF